MWHGFIRVPPFRKAAKVPYPIPYALGDKASERTKEEYLFNCAQRAHAQFLEHYDIFLTTLLAAGLQYPVASSVMGVGWLISRVVYAVGYTRKDKDKGQGRALGLTYMLFELGMIALTGKVGWNVLMA